MKLFIDTSNKKIILAIIDEKNEIVDFFIKDSNNDIVKNIIVFIEKFLLKNKLKFIHIKEYMITIGPGSFTGVKIPLNIVKTINIVYEVEKLYVIDSFNLLKDSSKKNIAIPFGKNKFYFKKSGFSKIKIVDKEFLNDIENVVFGYENFSEETLKEKINNKEFKLLDNLDKAKIKYLNRF